MKQVMFVKFSLLFVAVLCLPHTFAQDVPYTQLISGEGHTGRVLSVSFSPDGKTLASGSSDRTLRLWHADTGTHLKTLEGHTETVLSVSFSPDGKTLASGSFDSTIRLWDADTGTHLKTLEGHTGILSVSFSPDGNTISLE